MKNKIHLLTDSERAGIAGFLDGDGSIYAQIVKRPDYRLKFQIKATVCFIQKTSRYWYLMWLQSKLGCGVLRKRNDGYSELILSGHTLVKALLKALGPHLLIKNKIAYHVIALIDSLSKDQPVESFLYSCALVDTIATQTYSKKIFITSKTVTAVLKPCTEILSP